MNEVFLIFDKESEDTRDLYSILANNYSLNVGLRVEEQTVESAIETLREAKLAIYCLTNQFVKSEEFTRTFDASKKFKKHFLLVKLEEILVKNVKLVAVLFDDKKCFDFCKEKERRNNFRLLYHPRFQDFIKTVSHCLQKELDLKYKESRQICYAKSDLQLERHVVEGPDKSLKNLVQIVENLTEQVEKLGIENPGLEKAVRFIQNFVAKMDGEGSPEKVGENGDTGLIEKFNKIESEVMILNDELMFYQNQAVSFEERLREFEAENAAQKEEIDSLKEQLLSANEQIESLKNNMETPKNQDESFEASVNYSDETVIKNDKYENQSAETHTTRATAHEITETTTANTKLAHEEAYEDLMKEIVYEIHHSRSSNMNETADNQSTGSTSLESVLSSFSNTNLLPSKNFNLGCGLVARMTLRNDKEILAIDNEKSLIYVVDINGDEDQQIRSVTPMTPRGQHLLNMPINIHKTSNEKIYITNYCDSSILVFDSNLNFTNEIGFSINGIKAIDFLDVDEQNPDIVYLVDYMSEKVSIFDLRVGKELSSIGDDIKPWNIKTKLNKIYIVSLTVWDWQNEDKRMYRCVTGGHNCIYTFDKDNLASKNEIRLDNWLRPEGLSINNDGLVFTTAFKIDENSVVSPYRRLFTFNQKHELVKEIPLAEISWFHDFLVHGSRCIFTGADKQEEEQWIKAFEIDF